MCLGCYNNNNSSYKPIINCRTVYKQQECVSNMLEIAKSKIKALEDSMSGAAIPASERNLLDVISHGMEE